MDSVRPWMEIARKELGTTEIPGPKSNQRIVEYLSSTTLDKASARKDETPWCASFVNWCMKQANAPHTDSAWARSWLRWGKPTSEPQEGDIVVFSRKGGGGHVGFYISQTADTIVVLGGNQNNKVCEAHYPKNRLLGYRTLG